MSRATNNTAGSRQQLYRVLALITVIVVLSGAFAAVALYALASEPGTIRTTAALDRATVAPGDPFTLTVTIENTGSDPVTVQAVGLEDALLAGAGVTGVEPVFRSAEERSYPMLGDWTEYPLDQRVSGGAELVVTLALQATTSGTYNGEITVWVEGDFLGMATSRARRESITFDVQ